MKPYVEALRRELHKFPPSFGDADSILEMLYGCYNQCNRMDTEAIKAGFEELYEQMAGMPLREMDDIIYTACTLCREHEKSGFIEGVKVGMFLAQELK
jgi:hypothetical protein